jgi:hypothetical protein
MYNKNNDWIVQQYIREITPKLEGKDFYYNEDGRRVMTEYFHLKRGNCCENGCKHCPYKKEK